MRGSGIAELSRCALENALRRTTERLAAEAASPTPVAPEWTEPEWRVARAVAAIHGIAPLLRWQLRWRGPEEWERFLSHEWGLEQQRHRRITELLGFLREGLRSAGVPAVALKGAALYGTGLYRPGERPMADVDLLVHPGDVTGAAGMLGTLGFEESCRDWKNRVFSVREGGAFWRPAQPGDHPIKIELHERICERLPVRAADISMCVLPQHASAGLNPYPSRGSLIAHLLFHAAGSLVDRLLRFIQLHDIALLAGVATDEDWGEVLRIGTGEGSPWWAFPPLALTARYYPGFVPSWVLDAARTTCPGILRRISLRQRLSNASLSFPWIEAFPGLAWCRSPAEALEYVAQRILGGREAATLRGVASTAEPGLSARERRWLAVPQGVRIVRWLVSRPARPLTMRVVRSSFGISS